MNINIRLIEKKDAPALIEVAREAFWNLYRPGAEEHLVVHQMLHHADWVRDVSFLIEVDNAIVGAVFYSKATVELLHGEPLATLAMGPLCILPKLHRQGMGRRLMEHSLAKIKALGYPLIVTLGYDYHYAPYGFVSAKKYGIYLEEGIYYKGLLALDFTQNAGKSYAGKVILSDVFAVDSDALLAFERQFPAKEKAVLPSQARFAQAVVAIDEAEYE
ncbi:GNAT family N-acetyltransferase [Entomospira culicis]|uniref:N-acetyltransferase n=1 Tax=Entomospira culicis TaxID=2719989 RepID=A0A968GJT7_9SPIO|nr:N-acetyltransferase [Entomospira culicis]NIZ18945.1 N-acetyltransferase [Entomospira culicis]NIZ69160.1 N-acetyltransferase [Entomospira culicis]WDI37747.1 N-acetyltransferase [Entomospira culicis]WDI39375.1 N-acetyltransferase [Entomospira culicis]